MIIGGALGFRIGSGGCMTLKAACISISLKTQRHTEAWQKHVIETAYETNDKPRVQLRCRKSQD
jgi:hypothetical protein